MLNKDDSSKGGSSLLSKIAIPGAIILDLHPVGLALLEAVYNYFYRRLATSLLERESITKDEYAEFILTLEAAKDETSRQDPGNGSRTAGVPVPDSDPDRDRNSDGAS